MTGGSEAGMGGYSVFFETIADMTWTQVEASAKRGALMLVPVAVIEQHGPHLPLATDTYGAYLLCSRTRASLEEAGVEAVIAPPYYWGLNPSTGMFPGSLSIEKETMVSALSQLLQEFARFGFVRQFIVNHHGDPTHNEAVAEAIKTVRARGIDAVLTLGGFIGQVVEQAYRSAFGKSLPLPDEAILKAEESERTRQARARLMKSTLNVHAEERETSMIMRWFPELLSDAVDVSALEPALPSPEDLTAAIEGGRWREVAPLGYIGDPSVATEDNGELYELEARDIATAITEFIGRD